jgi:hypothetical protein
LQFSCVTEFFAGKTVCQQLAASFLDAGLFSPVPEEERIIVVTFMGTTDSLNYAN